MRKIHNSFLRKEKKKTFSPPGLPRMEAGWRCRVGWGPSFWCSSRPACQCQVCRWGSWPGRPARRLYSFRTGSPKTLRSRWTLRCRCLPASPRETRNGNLTERRRTVSMELKEERRSDHKRTNCKQYRCRSALQVEAFLLYLEGQEICFLNKRMNKYTYSSIDVLYLDKRKTRLHVFTVNHTSIKTCTSFYWLKAPLFSWFSFFMIVSYAIFWCFTPSIVFQLF